MRLIVRAGQKPFQNLRAIRETELAEIFLLHLVCAWIGNDETTAKKHYLQVTDAHFAGRLEGSIIEQKKRR